MAYDSPRIEPPGSASSSTASSGSSRRFGALPARVIILAWCLLTAILVVGNPTALGRIGVASNVLFLTTGSAFAVVFVHARRGEYRVLAGILGLSLSLASLVIASMVFLQSHAWTPTRVAMAIVIETAVISCLPRFAVGAPTDIATEDHDHRPDDPVDQPEPAAAVPATAPAADTR